MINGDGDSDGCTFSGTVPNVAPLFILTTALPGNRPFLETGFQMRESRLQVTKTVSSPKSASGGGKAGSQAGLTPATMA